MPIMSTCGISSCVYGEYQDATDAGGKNMKRNFYFMLDLPLQHHFSISARCLYLYLYFPLSLVKET